MKLNRSLVLMDKFSDFQPKIGNDVDSNQSGESIRDEYMAQRGWTRIGSGAFGTVFKNPTQPGWVLKLFGWDPAYMRFYSLAKRTDNPHFPEVSRMGTVVVPISRLRPEVKFNAVMIEELAPFHSNQSDLFQAMVDYADWYLNTRFPDHRPAALAKLAPVVESAYPHFRAACELLRPIIDKPAPLSAVARARGIQQRSYWHDGKDENYRLRGDTPVFTDQFAA